MRSIVSLFLLFAVAGCVAPEQAPPPRPAVARAYQPVTSSVPFEDAPLPNRKIGGTNDSVIRIAR